MKVIGLTGSIGSGKSTVSRFLAELGAVIIDTDKVGHEALEPDTELWREVVTAFGRQILTPTGEINRKKLGKMVFGNPELLTRLNQIIHPPMYDTVKSQLEEFRQQGVEVVVLDAPLLLEANWTSLVDEVWVTEATESTVLRRLKEKWGLTEQQSLARLRSQLPPEERIKQSDKVINTDCSLDKLEAKVKKLWQELAFDT